MADDDASERAEGVHRLVDMVVEEVSLVDRAANQRRFLIVKRRQKMADEGTPAPDDAPADGNGGGAATGGSVTPEAMSAVMEALGALTELVTTHSAAKAFPPKKPEGGDDEEDGDDDDDEDAEQRRKAAESISALLGQVKAALARLQAAAAAPAKKNAPTNDPVLAKLESIAASIAKLETQLKDQGDRIGKVEKNVGLPASRTPEGGGKGGADDDADVSWPMDLNSPVDRASVDKSLIFHDAGDK
jgi:hypothetical protein